MIWKITLSHDSQGKWESYVAFAEYPSREQVKDLLLRHFPQLDHHYVELIESGSYDIVQITVLE